MLQTIGAIKSPLLMGLINSRPRSSLYDYYNNNNNYMINDLTTTTRVMQQQQQQQQESSIYRRKAPSLLSLAATNVAAAEAEQIIIFNIGDYVQLENSSSSYVQLFDQSSINYCNFDANLLSSKRISFKKSTIPKPTFHVNTFLKGDSFNASSKINGISIFFSTDFSYLDPKSD